jgi:hypothetical protein
MVWLIKSGILMADLSLAEVALHAVFRSRLGKAEMIWVFVYYETSKPRMKSTLESKAWIRSPCITHHLQGKVVF